MKLVWISVILISKISGYKLFPGVYSNYHNYDFFIDPNFTNDQINVIQEAFNQWRSAGAPISLVNYGEEGQLFDGINTIFISTQPQLGDTLVKAHFDVTTGWAIFEADIRINISKISDDSSLYNIMLHELGHALGLDHSDTTNSVMGGAIPVDQMGNTIPQPKNSLHVDDLYGLYQAMI